MATVMQRIDMQKNGIQRRKPEGIREVIAGGVARGARAYYDRARSRYQEALASRAAATKVEFPNTGYFLPVIYAITGHKVETLGDIQWVLDEAEKLADHVVILDHGSVIAQGSPASLMSATITAEVRFGAPPGLDVAALSTRIAAPVTEVEPGEYRVGAAGSPALVAALTAWLAERDLPLADLRASRQRLEDVFLRLVSEPGAPPVAPEPDARRQRRRGPRR